MISRRLAGRRIMVTRPADDAEQWADRLRHLGAEPIVLPCLAILPVESDAAARALREAVANARWLVLNSRRGVAAAARLIDGAMPRTLRVAVVGPATARAAAELLGRVDLVATESTSRGLARALLQRLAADGATDGAARVVVAGAANGRTDVEQALDEAGIAVTRIVLYSSVPAPPAIVKHDLSVQGVDDILLASPSAAEGLVNQAVVPAGVHVITIGPTTTAAALAVGLTVSAEARHPDLDGLLEALP